MDASETQTLFDSLYNAKTSAEVASILEGIGDHADIGHRMELGESKLMWRLLGDNLSNQSTVGLATKPGRSITERLTNAFDAILEKRAQATPGPLPVSPSAAAERWFGRPPSGPDTGLFTWRYQTDQYDKFAAMVLLDSEVPATATIDVFDRGSGIRNEDIPSTILSLQQGNKITKKYLAGAYGQGGASTFSFCDYALILSRAVASPNLVSFTVVRILTLSDDYKVDAYAYLASVDGDNNVPSITCTEDLQLYPFMKNREEIQRTLGNGISSGTLIRHYTYRLTNLDGKLGPAPGNLYHYPATFTF